MEMTKENSKIPLGKDTQYPKGFDASLLFAIPRSQARESLGFVSEGVGQELPFVGYDEWTLYELSWLDADGSPQVAIGLLRIPADSEFIVESKSLKLYANGLYYKCFNSSEELVKQVTGDLNKLLNCQVQFRLIGLDGLWTCSYTNLDTDQNQAGYQSIDHCLVAPSKQPDIKQLSGMPSEGEYRYQTQRFRSLCPVTRQPDWASVYIVLKGVSVDMRSLAQYLAGFSEHQGFHENCVERIYVELQNQLKPVDISVAARYTRRGGIDINPIRASSDGLLEMPQRELRQ